jgi:nucleoid DNA-binding protein
VSSVFADALSAVKVVANVDMTRNELIDRLNQGQPHLSHEDVAFAVKTLLDQMSDTLAHGGRIEIRGFGAFSLHRRRSRVSRNPLTRSWRRESAYLTHIPEKAGIQRCRRLATTGWR